MMRPQYLKGLSTKVVMMLWPGNKNSEYRVHKIELCDCTYDIFKRTIAEEVKSNAAYLRYGLKTCGKVITITQLETKYK